MCIKYILMGTTVEANVSYMSCLKIVTLAHGLHEERMHLVAAEQSGLGAPERLRNARGDIAVAAQ